MNNSQLHAIQRACIIVRLSDFHFLLENSSARFVAICKMKRVARFETFQYTLCVNTTNGFFYSLKKVRTKLHAVIKMFKRGNKKQKQKY